jgi:ionotropic glutamate receptor
MEASPFVIVRNISTHSQNWNSINHGEQGNCLLEPLKTKIPHIVICGFIADFIRELQQQMHFNYTIDVADPTTNYHKLATSVANDSRQYDIILSNIRITSNRLLTVDFSTPFDENTFRIITRQNPYSSTLSLFNCFNPFTWKVWVAILAVIIYSGIIIYLFERQSIKTENTKSRVRSISIGVCQALTSVLIMNGDVPLTTNSSRLTVLGLYALGIILVATYTANLSSFLTLNRAQPSISGIDDIKNGRLPFSHIGIVTNSAISDYYIQNISTTYYPLTTAEEIYSRLLDYTIDASIWDSSVLEYATNNHYCDKLTVVGVGFVKSSFGVVLPKDWIYKKDLDVHILALRESERLEVLENMWLGKRNCPSTLRNTDNNAGGSASDTLSLDVMSGFFLTFLILTAVAFGLHLWHCRAPIVANIGQVIKLPTKF